MNVKCSQRSFCICSQWFLSWDKVVMMMYWFLLWNESAICICASSLVDHPPEPCHPTNLGHDRPLSWASFAIAVDTGYLFHQRCCMSIQFTPPSFPAPCPNIHCRGLPLLSLPWKISLSVAIFFRIHTYVWIYICLYLLSYFTMYPRL